MGINRNIVECKWISCASIPVIPVVLIETLWNVNFKGMISVEDLWEY